MHAFKYWLSALALVIVSTLVFDASAQQACVPGQQVACACPGGADGVQVCAQDGSRFEACVCADASPEPPEPEPAPPPPEPTPAPTPAPEAPAPKQPAATLGELKITSSHSGEVIIDGQKYGQPPVALDNLKPGSYRVVIEFDKVGGERRETAMVYAGGQASVHFEPSRARAKAGFRRGANVGAAVGGAGFGGDGGAGGGGRADFIVNIGIVPAIDFRTGLNLFIGSWHDFPAAFIGLPAQFHFNLGSVYTIMIGGMVGISSLERNVEFPGGDPFDDDDDEQRAIRATNIFGGPTASLLGFRFGSRRQFEIIGQNTAMWTVHPDRDGRGSTELDPFFRGDLTFGMLFLPSEL